MRLSSGSGSAWPAVMRVSDPDSILLADLAALAPRLRTAVLGALTAGERAALEALRTGSARDGGRSDDAVSGDVDDAISPWLAAQIQHAREGRGSLTSTARHALLRGIEGEAGPGLNAGNARPAMADPAGRSLMGAMGGILSTRKGRS